MEIPAEASESASGMSIELSPELRETIEDAALASSKENEIRGLLFYRGEKVA